MKRRIAQRRLNVAQLDQQKAALAAIDIQEKQIRAQIRAAEAQVSLAADNLRYTRILSPADGLVGQRQVRPGQFVNVGTQVIAVVPLPNIWVIANLQGDADDQHARRPAGARSRSTPFPISCSRATSKAGRRGPEAHSRCCRPTTRPAISPRSCSAFR